jgi:prevent-host-death family protein
VKRAAISELKAKLSEYIARVKRGEEVLVTERGRPVARLVPVSPVAAEDDRIRELVRRGIVRAEKGQLRRVLSKLPVCTVREGAVLRALEEERQERG